MAHIPDGVLSLPVLVGGGALAAAGLALGLRRLQEDEIPKVAILACAFFAASAFAVPVGPSSVHLLLSGLMGLMIGPAAFPAIFLGLVLQALLFGFGGLSPLGVNTVNIAVPGVLAGALLGPLVRRSSPAMAGVFGALAAGSAVIGTAGLVALSLVLSASEFVPSARVILLTYVPLALGEALVTGFAVSFLAKVRPEALRMAEPAPAPSPTAQAVLSERP